MKNIIKLLKAHAYDKAKEAAKKGTVPDVKSQLKLFQMLDLSLTTEEALIIRIIYHDGGFMYDINHLIGEIEKSVIESLDWAKINTLIEEAPLQISNLVLLIMTIYQHKNDEKAKETLLNYDRLYNLDTVSWPENVKASCQNMIAEIKS